MYILRYKLRRQIMQDAGIRLMLLCRHFQMRRKEVLKFMQVIHVIYSQLRIIVMSIMILIHVWQVSKFVRGICINPAPRRRDLCFVAHLFRVEIISIRIVFNDWRVYDVNYTSIKNIIHQNYEIKYVSSTLIWTLCASK